MDWDSKTSTLVLLLLIVITVCAAAPTLTKSTVEFYREGKNITCTWKPLDRVYTAIAIRYCDVTKSVFPLPCSFHNVSDVRATKTSFPVTEQELKYNCSLIVYGQNVNYSSPFVAAMFVLQNSTYSPMRWSGGLAHNVLWSRISSQKITHTQHISLNGAFVDNTQTALYRVQLWINGPRQARILSNQLPRVSVKPNFKNVTFIRNDDVITGSWSAFGESYPALQIRYCEYADKKAVNCLVHRVGDPRTTTSSFKVTNGKRYVCILAVIDVTGQIFFSESKFPKSNTASNATVVIAVVVVVIIVVLIGVGVILFFVIRKYCRLKEKYFISTDNLKKKERSGRKASRQISQDLMVLTNDDAGKYRGSVENLAFSGIEDETSNGGVKPTKSKKLKFPKVKMSIKKSGGFSTSEDTDDVPNYKGGKLEIESYAKEQETPGMVTLPELDNRFRKLSTDLDADDDELNLELQTVPTTDVIIEADNPYIKMDPPGSHDEYIKMGLTNENGAHDDDVNSSTESQRDVELEIDAEPLKLAIPQTSGLDSQASSRSNSNTDSPPIIIGSGQSKYDGTLDLRFAGLKDSDPDLQGDSDDSEVMNVGRPTERARSLDFSGAGLGFELPYGERFVPEELDAEAEVDVNVEAELEASDFPEDPATGTVIDADRDGGLIHVPEGVVSVEPGHMELERQRSNQESENSESSKTSGPKYGSVTFGSAKVDSNSDKVESPKSGNVIADKSDRSEHSEKISEIPSVKSDKDIKKASIRRKCSKLGDEGHVCRHVTRQHSRSDSSSSFCSTCISRSPTKSRSRSASSSSETFSHTYSSSGSDTDKDVDEIEDEVLADENRKATIETPSGIGADIHVTDDVAVTAPVIGPGSDSDLEVEAGLAAPAGFGDEPDFALDASTGLNLDVDLGL